MPSLLTPQVPILELMARSTVIYLALLIGLRWFGRREVGQFTLFDLVLILLVANAVQPAMTGPDASLTGGLVIIVTLLVLNFAVARLRAYFPAFARLVELRGVVVGQDGRWLADELKRQGIDDEEAAAALREHGLSSVEETSLVVLEGDGSLSVVPRAGSTFRRQRRVRFVKR